MDKKSENVIANLLSARSTILTQKSHRMADPPHGKDKLTHKMGDLVITTDQGKLKKGIKFEIEQAEIVHGYARYFGAGVWHRQQDIKKGAK